MSPAIGRWTRLLAAISLAALALGAIAQQQASESELKAAYLYRFLSFIEWPAGRFAGPQAPIVVAVAGAPEIAEQLSLAAQGRSAQGRPIAVRALGPRDDPAGAHVLFIGGRAAGRLAALARSASPATLVVSDSDGALDAGSMINFIEVEGRLRFIVALDAAERAGLRISSRMLAVASEVRPHRP